MLLTIAIPGKQITYITFLKVKISWAYIITYRVTFKTPNLRLIFITNLAWKRINYIFRNQLPLTYVLKFYSVEKHFFRNFRNFYWKNCKTTCGSEIILMNNVSEFHIKEARRTSMEIAIYTAIYIYILKL